MRCLEVVDIPRKLTPADLAEARRLYEAGHAFQQLAPIVGLHPETIRKAFHRFGWRVRGNTEGVMVANTPFYRRLFDRYASGESALTIATEADMDVGNLVDAWRRRRWYTRNRSEAAILREARLTPEQRRQQTAASHALRRGQTDPPEVLAARADTRMRRVLHASRHEHALAGWLRQCGFSVIQQYVVGPFNIDIAFEHVAIELLGSHWRGGPRAIARWPRRTRYLLNHGWTVVAIYDYPRGHAFGLGSADYFLSLAERARQFPALRGQYRVLRSDGKVVVRGCAQDDYFPVIPPRGTRLPICCPHDLPPD